MRVGRMIVLWATVAILAVGCDDSSDTPRTTTQTDAIATTSASSSTTSSRRTRSRLTAQPRLPEGQIDETTPPESPPLNDIADTPTPIPQPFQQVEGLTIAGTDQIVIRSIAEWNAWLATRPFVVWQVSLTGEEILPAPPCNFDESMLVAFGLGSFSGCGPPPLTVTDVFILDGSMMIVYQTGPASPGHPVSFDGWEGWLTCPAFFPMSFAVCVPQFDGPVEKVGAGFPLLTLAQTSE